MANSASAATKVWIFRKGSGQLKVHPSPVLLSRGEAFTIKNLANGAATVKFPPESVDGGPVEITAGGTSRELRASQKPGYFEYDVAIGNEYADGGSKPGGIIDP